MTEGKETVQKLAALARINIPDEEQDAIAEEFKGIVAYIGKLDELDISVGGTPVVPPLHNVLRDDENPTAPATWTDTIVAAFPSKSGNALTVKKIIAHD